MNKISKHDKHLNTLSIILITLLAVISMFGLLQLSMNLKTMFGKATTTFPTGADESCAGVDAGVNGTCRGDFACCYERCVEIPSCDGEDDYTDILTCGNRDFICVGGEIVGKDMSGEACTPSAEVCDDGVDNDCDGAVDCSDDDCSNNLACQTGGGCTSNDNCLNSDTPFCNTDLGSCVECLEDAQCDDNDDSTTDTCSNNVCKHETQTTSCDTTECDAKDDWYDTGNTQYVPDNSNKCVEVEQKEQEYRDYYCNGDKTECVYEVMETQWVDTGNTRNKPDGTRCVSSNVIGSIGSCSNGECVASGGSGGGLGGGGSSGGSGGGFGG